VIEERIGSDPTKNICRNYLLTKAWGKHTFGKDEDQKRITYMRAKQFIQGLDDARNRKTQRGQDMDLAGNVASLVTIRNRWDICAGLPLSSVIRDVKARMPSLTTFLCCFCRAPMFNLPGQTPEGPMVKAILT
jgi:hypothetical protein